MTGKRKLPDPLSRARLYVRAGRLLTTFYIKKEDNTNVILATARTGNRQDLRRAKREAETQYDEMSGNSAEQRNVRWLGTEYFKWQASLPTHQRKAASTLAENASEAKNLYQFFGHMMPDAVQPFHCYAYIDARTKATGAAVKAGKEIGLLSALLEYGRRIGVVRENAAKGIEKPRNPPRQTLVTWAHIELLTRAGREAGGSYHIAALAMRFAWLTLRRPGEVLSFTEKQVTDAGCVFTASKRRANEAEKRGLIEWSDELRETVNEAMGLKRWAVFGGSRLLFANLAGERYTKGGWKATMSRLMLKAEALAAKDDVEWVRFSLQDCRPGGVTEKQERGDTDTTDGTLHSDGRMVAQVYDRRRVRKSTPAK